MTKMRSKNVARIAVATGVILLLLLVAMQFTGEVRWNLFDFIIMGVLLFVTGLAMEFAVIKSNNLTNRVIAVVAVLAVFFLIWAELAVGVFSTPFAGS